MNNREPSSTKTSCRSERLRGERGKDRRAATQIAHSASKHRGGWWLEELNASGWRLVWSVQNIRGQRGLRCSSECKFNSCSNNKTFFFHVEYNFRITLKGNLSNHNRYFNHIKCNPPCSTSCSYNCRSPPSKCYNTNGSDMQEDVLWCCFSHDPPTAA